MATGFDHEAAIRFALTGPPRSRVGSAEERTSTRHSSPCSRPNGITAEVARVEAAVTEAEDGDELLGDVMRDVHVHPWVRPG